MSKFKIVYDTTDGGKAEIEGPTLEIAYATYLTHLKPHIPENELARVVFRIGKQTVTEEQFTSNINSRLLEVCVSLNKEGLKEVEE